MKRLIRAVIADDEPLARDAVRLLLAGDPDTSVVAECRDGLEAVTAIRELNPDLIFLDVQMPHLDGFGVVERVGVGDMPVTVFVTAYDQFALDAFAAHALDYLLKPFGPERFGAALGRAKGLIHLRRHGELSSSLISLLDDLRRGRQLADPARDSTAAGAKYLERLTVKATGRIFFLNVEEIEWVEAAGDYLRVHVGGKAHMLRAKIGDLAARLDPARFMRIHRSTIVNVERIRDIRPLFKGEHVVTLLDGTQLRMSRGYRFVLKSFLDDQHP